MSKASELGVLIALILGPKEIEQNQVSIRTMATGTQKTVDMENLLEELYKIYDELEESDEIND